MHDRIEIFPELMPALAEDYLEHVKPLLERIPDGSGRARETGLKDGWISGLSMYRYESAADMRFSFVAATASLLRATGSETIRNVMVNRIEPGAGLKPHVDGAPYYDRWHLPIITHPDCKVWTMQHGYEHFPLGYWSGPLDYAQRHGIEIPETVPTARVHLVIDLEK